MRTKRAGYHLATTASFPQASGGDRLSGSPRPDKTVTMSRMIALAFAAITLAACEQRDKGADVAACQLEELKSNYPEKVSLERELEKAANIDQSREYFKMLKSKKFEFLRLCMRVKGWDAKPETSCLQQYLDQANCYVRASGIGD